MTHCARNVPERRLLSIKEVVRRYGVSLWWWRCQLWGGNLPYLQVGRKILIDSMDIEAFIAKNKRQ